MSLRSVKRKIPNRVFVVFYPKHINENIATAGEYKKNKKYVSDVVKSTFPRATELDSRSEDEIIFSFAYNPKWQYPDKRSFMIRLEALFLLTEDYCPHFTTYEFYDK